jgi:beta-propeller repeat-containing protein
VIEERKGGGAMSVAAGLGTAAAGAAGVPTSTGERPATRGRTSPTTKKALVVAVALLALAALAALIPSSDAPNNAQHYSSSSSSAGTTADDKSGAAGAPVSQPTAPRMSEREAFEAYEKLPLSFVPNEGQSAEEAVRYYAQGAGYGFFFTKGGATLSFADGEGSGHALALDFLGPNPDATLAAQERLSGEVNYLVGDDPAKWRRGLPTHGELLYGGLWPGIDMAVRGEEGGKLKYEFHLKPGSSVEDVRLAYRGAEGLSVGAGGELLVQTSLGVLKDAAPVSYQLIGGERVAVESRYRLLGGDGGGGFGFAVGSYDPRYPLVIDPGLEYSTFLVSGAGDDEGAGIAVDGEGRAYVTGETESAGFPTTPGAFDTTLDPDVFQDAFVTQLPTG